MKRLGRDLGIPDFLARVLARNGYEDPEGAVDFLQPKLRNLGDPFLLPDMAKAAERVHEAIRRGERIALYGDYDVDGAASLALLKGLHRRSAAKLPASCPAGRGGYGLSASGWNAASRSTIRSFSSRWIAARIPRAKPPAFAAAVRISSSSITTNLPERVPIAWRS